MKLTLAEIKGCLERLIQLLEERGVDSADTNSRDFYWTILSDDWLDFQTKPSPGVGSLDDDFKELRRVILSERPSTPIDLERMASVLRLVADDLSQ